MNVGQSARVWFATNRNPNRKNDPDDFGGRFNPDAVDSLRFGSAKLKKKKKGFTTTSVTVAPEKLRTDFSEAVLGSKSVFVDLQSSMREGVDTLVFIHGYNVSFHEALATGARIVDVYAGSPAINVVVFSWPSDGSMVPFMAYKRDRGDAAASAPAFGRALLKLSDFLEEVRRGQECNARLHLMAHSMGNYVLRNGIYEVKRYLGGKLPQMFDEIFLMAADEDDDAFELEHKLQPLPQLGTRISVYFNRGDTALVVSDKTKSNPTRLGSRGPRLPLNVPGNVTLVDVSEVVSGVVEHSYFIDDKKTVSDVKAVLKQKPEDKIPGRRYVASQNRYVIG